MKNILVTGAAGQIGSELTLELRRKFGCEHVIAAGHSKRLDERLRESGPSEYIDVTHGETVDKVIKTHSIDTIFHLAAVLSVKGEKNPQLTWNVNVHGLMNILEIAKERKISKVFWPSSIAVFGQKAPRIETPLYTPLIPSTIYGVSKVSGELLCHYYFNRYGLDVRSVRFPGIISSNTPPGGGVTDYAVEMFYNALKKKRYRCFVNKKTVLPMMYIPDCIKAAIDLMETEQSKVSCRTSYNIGGMSFSAEELATEIKKYVPGFVCEFRPDFRQRIADSWPMSIDDSEAREQLGWKPIHGLTSMTKDMIEKLRIRFPETRL